MAGKIFLNYRRNDDPGFTMALYQRLEREFGQSRLFMDVEGAIAPGDTFADILREQVSRADIVLVMIGPRWLDLLAARSGDAKDFVLIEIEAALDQGKRVVPVLVGGARLPTESALPPQLRPLAARNAVELRPTRFRADCDALTASLRLLIGDAPAPAPAGPERTAFARARPALSRTGAALFAAPEPAKPGPPFWLTPPEIRGALVTAFTVFMVLVVYYWTTDFVQNPLASLLLNAFPAAFTGMLREFSALITAASGLYLLILLVVAFIRRGRETLIERWVFILFGWVFCLVLSEFLVGLSGFSKSGVAYIAAITVLPAGVVAMLSYSLFVRRRRFFLLEAVLFVGLLFLVAAVGGLNALFGMSANFIGVAAPFAALAALLTPKSVLRRVFRTRVWAATPEPAAATAIDRSARSTAPSR